MKKILLASPSYLTTATNRDANYECLSWAANHYDVDNIGILNQAYTPYDRRNLLRRVDEDKKDKVLFWFEDDHPKLGITQSRNTILKKFYNSDYDYLMWIDSNSKVSRPNLNELNTILGALKKGTLDEDAIFCSLGVIASSFSKTVKLLPDGSYLKNATLMDAAPVVPLDDDEKVETKCAYMWFHGTIMKNFKKAYGISMMIPHECDNYEYYRQNHLPQPPDVPFLPEDVVFTRMLHYHFDCKYAPAIQVSKLHGPKSSTWANGDTAKYDYPKTDELGVKELIKAHWYGDKFTKIPRKLGKGNYTFVPRIEKDLEFVVPFKSRGK